MPPRAGKVLILSPHAMTAALVGWYVELVSLEPAFAAPDERPQDALSRVRPILVVLIDSELDEGLSDLLAMRASKRGVGLAVFGHARGHEEARRWAEDQDVPFFSLPIDIEAFSRVLDQAARQTEEERRIANRRREPATDRAVDGTLVLFDAGGCAWYVYDRRAGERRLDEREKGRAYRLFVSENGVERRCDLTEAELTIQDARTLAAQLDRSAQVPPNHS